MTDDNSLEAIFALIKEIEARLLGLKQLRAYIRPGVERETLESLLEHSETKLAEIKRKVFQ